MFQKLMNTTDDFVMTLLRLALGVVFFAHGAQKALGWFGGYGFRGTLGFFTQQMHIPAVLAVEAPQANAHGASQRHGIHVVADCATDPGSSRMP